MNKKFAFAMTLLLLVLLAACAKKAVPTAQGVILGSDAQVQCANVFTKCGHRMSQTLPAGEYAGMTAMQVENSSQAIRVVSFEPDNVVMERYIDGYCPDHYLLKIKGKGIAIYKTDTKSLELQERMSIVFDLAQLPGETRQVLEKGLIFNSLQEIEKYIEDLDS